MLKTLGNILIIGGALAVLLGLILTLSGRFKWIGRLPGDKIMDIARIKAVPKDFLA